MNNALRLCVIDLLESSLARKRKIALLHYELNHVVQTSRDEIIEAMVLGHGDGGGHTDGHISDKTLYIALNYQNMADKMNADTKEEIVVQLVRLEQEQNRLEYYISLLEKRQATVIRLSYLKGLTQNEVAKELEIVPRTVRRIRDEAVDKLVELYEFAKDFTE